MWPIKSTGRR